MPRKAAAWRRLCWIRPTSFNEAAAFDAAEGESEREDGREREGASMRPRRLMPRKGRYLRAICYAIARLQ